MPWASGDALTSANLNNKSGLVFNVKDPLYGALGNGITDDTIAIQSAITAAQTVNGTVSVPQGTYLLSPGSNNYALTIDAGARLVGSGVVTFKFATAAIDLSPFTEMVRINSNPSGSAVTGVVLDNIGFDANGLKNGMGVRGYNVNDVTVTRCRFTNFGQHGSGTFSYGCRMEGYGTPATPYVWAAGTPTGFSGGIRIVNNTFVDFTTGGGTSSANAIFLYQVDGAVVADNYFRQTGLACMTYGPNRHVTVANNILENGLDNGIRFELETAFITDVQRNREHSVIGNVIRNMPVDGIRLDGYRVTCVGNVSSENGNSGIKADCTQETVIAHNVLYDNANIGIYLTQASVAGELSHKNVLIQGNHCQGNAGHGIGAFGGGQAGTDPLHGIRVLDNTCRLNGFNGILLADGDDSCVISGNMCEQNGAGRHGGIVLQAVLMSWGGATIANNRCFDTTASPNSKQPIGIWLSAVTGLTLGQNQLLYNDCSDVHDSASYFGTPILDTGSLGTVSPQVLIGNRGINATRTIDQAALGTNLGTTDILLYLNEATGTWLAKHGDFWTDVTAPIVVIGNDPGGLDPLRVGGNATLSTLNSTTIVNTGLAGWGAGTSTNVGLYLRTGTATPQLAGATQYGLYSRPVFHSDGTTALRPIFAQIETMAAAFTATNGQTIYIANPQLGAGSALTTLTGLYIEALTAGGTNYAICTAGAGLVALGDTTDSTSATTGALTTAGGLGVAKALTVGTKLCISNAASATVGVGTLADKFPIYDATGTLLGYVPIYASIT